MNQPRMPIIRLEVEGMKYSMLQALSDQAMAFDASVQSAVEAFCTPENIDEIVRAEAKRALNDAVKQEVRSFFVGTGSGRRAVREAVLAFLDSVYPQEPSPPSPSAPSTP